uniref:Ionotropic receptor n=1 Tax=Phlebotomus papatasi TaxID=29031 RepID=A0A8W9BML7_PHLPP
MNSAWIICFSIIFLVVRTNIFTACENRVRKYKIPEENFKNPLSKLLGYIVMDFYSVETYKVTITRISENRRSALIQSGIVNEVLYDINGSTLVRLDEYPIIPTSITQFYNIFLVDSYQSFRKIFYGNSTKAFDFSGYYTIVLTNIEKNHTDFVTRVLNECWKLHMINVNVVTYDSNNLDRALMMTYFPFTANHCEEVNPVLSAIFENDTVRKSLTIFPDKLHNFHGCNLTVGTLQFPPFMMIIPKGNGTYYFDGLEGNILRALAEHLNFSINHKTHKELWGRNNGENSSGLFGMLCRGEVNFTIGAFATSAIRESCFTSTFSYKYTSLTLMIPPGRPYTALEELLMPFHLSVWICIFGILITTTSVVVLAKFWKPQKRSFIFGHGNNYPFISSINIFLGGSLRNTPRRNFARFLLMMWILLSLVLRSSYQAVLFGFLKEQRNFSAINSLDEMQKEGFKIYGVAVAADYFLESMMQYRNMYVPTTIEEVQKYRMQTMNYDFKGAVLTNEYMAAYMNKQYSKQNIMFYTLKPPILQLLFSILLRQDSYLTKLFNGELMKLWDSGLIQKWSSLFDDSMYLKETSDYVPGPLSLYQLRGIFTMYLFLIIISFLFFLLELLSRKSRLMKKLCNFLN